MRRRLIPPIAALVVLTATGALVIATSVSARPGLPELGMAGKRSATPDVAGYLKQHGPKSVVECTKALATTPSQLIDCDSILPNNEPDIELKARNAGMIVASSNDYDSCCDAFNTSTDAGVTWANGNMSRLNPRRTGSDPVTVYDKSHDVWLHTSLNFYINNGSGGRLCDGDVVVSPSKDGITWAPPTIIADGVGCDSSKAETTFHDKEWIAVDNNPASPHYGRAYVTWTAFNFVGEAYESSPIMESHSSNGGATWSTPKEISGSNPNCTYQATGPTGVCDENQFSVPVVMPNGNVAVAFENDQNESIWSGADEFDSQYLVVRSTNGGATWLSPVMAAAIADGASDYPINSRGRQTLTGYELRVIAAGNIAVSSTGKLAIVFSDNRAGTAGATNTNVYAVFSTDSGATWSPTPVGVDTSAGDQWFPWADFDPTTGKLGVVYNSRNQSNAALYNAVLAEEGSGTYAMSTLSARPSNPTDSVFFKAGVPGCERCATFHGDYIGLDYDASGVAHAVWTDMSIRVDDPTFGSGYIQLIAYAKK